MADGMIQNYPLAPSFRRRRESSETNTPQSGQNLGFVSLREDYSSNWIPACAGMTLFRFNEQPWLNLYCALFLLLAFHAVPAFAEELPDPTRPPAIIAMPVIAASGVASGVADKPARLQSIIISKTRRAAIIDGETVELGDKHGDAKLIEVNEGSIVLLSAEGRQVMALFPDVKMTITKATAKNEYRKVKTKPQSPQSKAQPQNQKANQAVVKDGK